MQRRVTFEEASTANDMAHSLYKNIQDELEIKEIIKKRIRNDFHDYDDLMDLIKRDGED